MRFFLITPYYFPNINPRAHRWTSIAEEWANSGHEVHVLCSKRNGFPNKSVLNGVTVHRIGYNSLKEIFYNFFRAEKRRGEARISKPKPLKRSRLMTFLVWLNETFWKKIYFPDDACVWYFPARKKAIQILESQKFDAVITVSLPFSTHLIGLHCKKKFPKTPWLVDIGDPFSLQFTHQLNNHFLYKKWNLKLEKRVFEKADSISVTTEGTKKLYVKYFKGFEKKITVIPPLLKLNPIEKSNFELKLDSSKIHIGYFGSFFKNIREPDLFLKLLNEVFLINPNLKNRLVIHFFGDIIEHFLKTFERHSNLKNNILLHGLIPREAIPNLMSQMNFLLNISNQSDFQLPSKSVDYLASGKPIINIYSIDKDLFKQFFKKYPNVLNLKIQDIEIFQELIEDFILFIGKMNGKKVKTEQVIQMIAPFKAKNISLKYINLLTREDRFYH